MLFCTSECGIACYWVPMKFYIFGFTIDLKAYYAKKATPVVNWFYY